MKRFEVGTLLRQADLEVRVLQRVPSSNCQYVIGLEGIALMAYTDYRLMVGLVMPMGSETLKQRYGRGSCVWDEEELRGLLFQMLLGVHELHYHSIWHKTLALGKFLFTDSTPHAAFSYSSEQLMLIDLGASQLLEELPRLQRVRISSTPQFAAPEYVAALRGRGTHGSPIGEQRVRRGISAQEGGGQWKTGNVQEGPSTHISSVSGAPA